MYIWKIKSYILVYHHKWSRSLFILDQHFYHKISSYDLLLRYNATNSAAHDGNEVNEYNLARHNQEGYDPTMGEYY